MIIVWIHLLATVAGSTFRIRVCAHLCAAIMKEQIFLVMSRHEYMRRRKYVNLAFGDT